MRHKREIPAGTLHKSGEDYLEAILMLQQSKGSVRAVDVGNLLNYSRPSVSNAVSVLKDAGYLTVDSDHLLHLTDEGRAIAERIYERHRFFTDFFTSIGVDPHQAETDACQMEHAISTESFDKLKDFLKDYPRK